MDTINNKFLTEDLPIRGTNNRVIDYWKWAHSNILDNTERGVFAEFLVGSALNALMHPRVEWDNADLQYRDYYIEVKSSAYIQSWKQQKNSRISFNIAPKFNWSGIGNVYGEEKQRFAQFYIFCLLKEVDRKKVNPLNTEQWEFYILPTKILNQKYKTQKQISLTPLQRLCNPLAYDDIKTTLDNLIAGS